MRILFPAAEVAPFSKTGGLADVAGALPKALARLGHEVLVVTPWYAKLGGGVPPYWVGDVASPFDRGFEPVGVGVLEDDVPGTGSVRYAFVGHQDFRRAKPYGYPDDARRFARFSRAVPSVAERLAFAPDLVHAHDWHTGYLPMILARGWHLPPGFPGLRSVFTVHNVQYQGESGLEDAVRWLRLGPDLMGSYLDHFGRANAMQAGVGFATRVTTVSPTYAEEIQTPEYGYSLDGTFRSLSGKLTGILNGIDTDVWDPARDPTLPEPYSAADLAGKSAAKRSSRGASASTREGRSWPSCPGSPSRRAWTCSSPPHPGCWSRAGRSSSSARAIRVWRRACPTWHALEAAWWARTSATPRTSPTSSTPVPTPWRCRAASSRAGSRSSSPCVTARCLSSGPRAASRTP